TAIFDGQPGIEVPLWVRLPAPRLTRIVVPRHALYFASRPGAVTAGTEGDAWERADQGSTPGSMELRPRSWFLRNAAFARLGGYLYRPNRGIVVVATGLAALALVLIRRPRPTGAEGR